MSEGIPPAGWVGRVRDMIYARLERTSFRSGVAVGAAVLAVAGVAVTLAVTLGGHRAPPPAATVAGAAPRSVQPSRSPPSSAALSPSAGAPARRAAPDPGSSAAANDGPEAHVTPATTQQAFRSPSLTTARPRFAPPTPWKGRRHGRPPARWPLPWRPPHPPR